MSHPLTQCVKLHEIRQLNFLWTLHWYARDSRYTYDRPTVVKAECTFRFVFMKLNTNFTQVSHVPLGFYDLKIYDV